jgi:hypothetical protein
MSLDPVSIDADRPIVTDSRVNGSIPAGSGSRVSSVSIAAHASLVESVESFFVLGSTTLADELADAIGLGLTRQNPVWTPAALDRIRELQHVLMKCAFSLPQEDRAPVLGGVKALEVAVTLRLRFDEAVYAAQQAELRRSAVAEQSDPQSDGKIESIKSRSVAA